VAEDDDPYAAERARLAAQREEQARRQRAAQQSAADKVPLEAIAEREVREIAARACRELRAGGIRPVRFIREVTTFWSGKRTHRTAHVPGEYWAITVRTTVLVNEQGMFWGALLANEGPTLEPIVWGTSVQPVQVGETYTRWTGDWDYPTMSWRIEAGPEGRPMMGVERLDTMVARDVVRQIETVQGR